MASSAGIVCALRYGEDRDVIDGLRLLERWVLTFVIITVYFISHFLITGFVISCLLIVCVVIVTVVYLFFLGRFRRCTPVFGRFHFDSIPFSIGVVVLAVILD